MVYMKKGAYIRLVDEATAEKLKNEGFSVMKVEEPAQETPKAAPAKRKPKPKE